MKKILFLSGIVISLVLLPLVFAQNSPGEQALVPEGAASPAALPNPTAADAIGLITVDFTDADIQKVLEIMALKGNVNIVAAPEVAGNVTMHLKDVPWQSAFEAIIRTYGFVYEQDGNIYQVYSPETSQKRMLEDVRSEIITLEYATLDQVKKALEKVLSAQGKLESISGTNQIVITDTSTQIRKVRHVVETIDRKMPQVMIDAKIVRTALSKGESLGIDWNWVASVRGARRPTTIPFSADPARDDAWDNGLKQSYLYPRGQTQILDTTTSTATGAVGTSQTVDFPPRSESGFPFALRDDFAFGTIDFTQFQAIFSMLASRRSTKIISNPRIVALNHQPARVQVGGEVGIPRFERNESTGSLEISGFDPRNFGIVLNVTPHITKEKEIVIDVQPEVTNFLGFIAIGGTGAASPQFETIVAKTSVLVHSGDTLVIGGLITDDEDDSRSKVPYLNRIPVAGWLFKGMKREPQQNKKAETIFFVTVTLADDVYNQKALDQWRQTQQEYEGFRKASEEDFLEKNKKEKKPEQKKKSWWGRKP